MTGRDYYNHHFGLVLDNDPGIQEAVRDWIESNLTNESKQEAANRLGKWLKSWIEDDIYDTLDRMGNGIGAQLINEVLDLSQVCWYDIAEGYLEDYEPEAEASEDEAEETEVEE